MIEWYVQSKPTFNGETEIDEFNNYVSDGLDEILNDTPLGVDITLCKGKYDDSTGLFETELKTKGVIQGVSPETQAKGTQRQLLTKINTITDYKYVKAENKIWLIMTMPTNNQIYEKVVLFLCNYTARWQNSNKEIIYQPFVVQNASQYNSGEEVTKTISLGYNQLLIYTSIDEDTKLLNRSSRMFIDYNINEPIPYRITRIDSVSFSYAEDRVMSLIMSEDQFNSDTDNKELMICDYITPPPIQSQPIVYSGEATIRNGGIKSFSIETDETISWEIETTDLTNQLQLTIVDNNHCKIKCLNNDNNIDKQFIVKAIGSTVNSSVTISVIGGL